MPKIKGWLKTTNRANNMCWVNSNDANKVVRVVSQKVTQEYYLYPYGRPKWDVWYGKKIRTFKTKEAALKFAINWMKRHPNG